MFTRLKANLKRWGVSDPGLCRTLAIKVHKYQFQHLQEFMEASDGDSQNQGGGNQEGSQLRMDNLLAFANCSQVTPSDFIG